MKILNKYLKRIKSFIHHSSLLFMNTVRTRALVLKSITLLDKLVIENNEVYFLWSVDGCHKIKIKGVGVFSGTIHGLKFIYKNNLNPVEVTFFGIGKKIHKTIAINSTSIEIKNNFKAEIDIPIMEEVYIQKPKLENLENIKCKIISDNISINFEKISFEFDTFNLEKYK